MALRVIFGYITMLLALAFAAFASWWVASFIWVEVAASKMIWGFLGFGVPAIFIAIGAAGLLKGDRTGSKAYASASLLYAGANVIALFVGMYQSISSGIASHGAAAFFGFGLPAVLAGVIGIRLLASRPRQTAKG